MKPGFKTTEFWVTLIAQIVTTFFTSTGQIDPSLGAGLVAGSAAAYGTQRTVAKRSA